ncbi:zinc finger protein 429-like [Cloeon dipterum]|uniref:zinc finger protein 429-like n=1 Tax=Cloeon dipterum TaxID=197152 RepID=UPI00321F9D12
MESQIRSQEMQPPTGKKGKPPIQKPLCRLCECPTSDGHVRASQVDRIKLRTWAMKVLDLRARDGNLPMLIGEDHLICYFCIWQAEFDDESGDDSLAWWPKNLDLAENAKILRENYSAGEVDQCWVQLEEVDLDKQTEEIPKKRKRRVGGVCIYCGNRYNQLMEHVKLMHKKAIKCGFYGCTTYFHTEKEKEQHMQEDIYAKHFKRRERRNVRCKFCKNVKFSRSLEVLRAHMNRFHPELVACTRVGCKEYFKSKSEMIQHIISSHKRAINQDHFKCMQCEYFTTVKCNLKKHVESKHMPKTFKCDSCDAKFGSKRIVNRHYQLCHTSTKCKSCGQEVVLGYKPIHGRPTVCSTCKRSFDCLGVFLFHKKMCCEENIHKCEECGKEFPKSWNLDCHVVRVHAKPVKAEYFRCEHCNYSTLHKSRVTEHMHWSHFPKTIKCDECDKLFATESFLKHHKRRSHQNVHCAECAQEVPRHTMSNHRLSKACHRCKGKFRCAGLYQLHWENCKQTVFTCKECGKMFTIHCELSRHVKRVHTKTVKTAVFLCAHCDHSSTDKRRMSDHMQCRHLPKKIKCKECNTRYASQYFLKRHINRWHEYVHCSECGQEVRRHAMFRHRRIKTCRYCERKAGCSGLLEQHEKNCRINSKQRGPDSCVNSKQQGPDSCVNSKQRGPDSCVNSKQRGPDSCGNSKQRGPDSCVNSKQRGPDSCVNSKQRGPDSCGNSKQRGPDSCVNSKQQGPDSCVNSKQRGPDSCDAQIWRPVDYGAK